MADEKGAELEALLEKQFLLNISLEQAEKDWKNLREESRKNALLLLTEHGISLARTSAITGHHRNTLKIWLDVYNAERKGQGSAE